MKQFFTLLVLVFTAVAANAQTGTIYRLQGTAGGTVNVSSNTHTGTNGFLRSTIWQVISSTTNPAWVGTNRSPQTGATLQIFGITLSIQDNADIDLSAFDFNIQIRSEGTSATSQNVGMLHSNDRPITFGAGSSITLGWGMRTFNNIVYFFPGYLHLQENGADIIIGSTTIASTGSNRSSYYLNANAYNVNATSGTQYNLAVGAPSSTHIMSGANAPTANITNKTVARVGGALFTIYPYFYNPPAGAGGSSVAPLPVQLINFNAAKATGKVVLTWTTAQEINSDYFDVQRSTDATNWKSVAIVKAAGNSGTIRNYHTEDAGSFTGNVYYRIKMVDKDATHANSNIARLSFAASNGKIFAYPNPASNYTVINSDQALSGKIQVEVINSVSGVRMLQQVFTNPGNSFRLNMNQLPAGNYVVNVYSEQALLQAIKIAKY
jgi:hypothetical protein